MPESALSPAAQQWIYVVLMWVGFGTLAGLLATVIFPLRRFITPFTAMVIGIVGSTVGLLGLSWLFPGRPLNPITSFGLPGRHDRRLCAAGSLPSWGYVLPPPRRRRQAVVHWL